MSMFDRLHLVWSVATCAIVAGRHESSDKSSAVEDCPTAVADCPTAIELASRQELAGLELSAT